MRNGVRKIKSRVDYRRFGDSSRLCPLDGCERRTRLSVRSMHSTVYFFFVVKGKSMSVQVKLGSGATRSVNDGNLQELCGESGCRINGIDGLPISAMKDSGLKGAPLHIEGAHR